MINRLAFLFVLLFLPIIIEAQEEKVPIPYTIQSGDTYSKIARQYNTKVDSLIKWNPQVEPTSLKVGKNITVGWKKVVEEQKHEEKAEEHSEKTIDSGAMRPTGDTNVPPLQSPKDEPAPKLEPPVVDPDSIPSHSYSWVWLLVGLFIGMVLGAFLLYVLFVKKLRAELEHKENELSRVNYSLTNEKSNNSSELSRLRLKN